MRIAHVVNSLEVGGAETLVAQLCRLQRQSGHAPAVHCLVQGGPLQERLRRDGIPVFVHGPGRRWQVAWRVYRGFRETRPDVVHCHNVKATINAAPLARLAGVRRVLCTRHSLVLPPQPVKQERLFWLAARCCQRVVAVCEATRRNLRLTSGARPAQIVTLRNGAAPAPVGMNDNDMPSKEGFTLLHVARMSPVKDQATLLRAVALARADVPDLRLWLVGDGPERGNLQCLAQELHLEACVSFGGERSDVGNWLARADAFVLCSLSEAMPMSLLEALAAGLPLIVTDVGAMPEVARLSGAGLVVPPRDVTALAQAITDLAQRRDQLPALGAAARRCYEDHFRPEIMADGYARLYQECGG
ncbi:MAG: glycosyltransferase [Gemmataceae bacterium]